MTVRKQGLLVRVLILSCLAASASAQSPSISPLPSDAQIRQILADRIDSASLKGRATNAVC